MSGTFRTKAAARAFFKEMLGRYEDGDTISEEDASFLDAILRRHQIIFRYR